LKKYKIEPKKIKIKIIGVGPGEKIHEQLITEDEADDIESIKDKIIILRPKIAGLEYSKTRNKKRFRYHLSSNNPDLLSKDEIKKILRKENL